MSRPLYDDDAQTYDTLFADPVEPWVDVVVAAAPPPGDLLDAGCGTGRQALALREAGYAVTIADGSATLLERARARLPGAPAHLTDLRSLALGITFDVITCRGVLNDVVEDDDRQAVLDRFHAHLRPGGALVLDVRDLEATRERYADGRTLRRDGLVSDGRMDGDLVRVVERVRGTVSEAVIRPWAPEEVERRLAAAGFASWELGASPQRADRLLAIARR